MSSTFPGPGPAEYHLRLVDGASHVSAWERHPNGQIILLNLRTDNGTDQGSKVIRFRDANIWDFSEDQQVKLSAICSTDRMTETWPLGILQTAAKFERLFYFALHRVRDHSWAMMHPARPTILYQPLLTTLDAFPQSHGSTSPRLGSVPGTSSRLESLPSEILQMIIHELLVDAWRVEIDQSHYHNHPSQTISYIRALAIRQVNRKLRDLSKECLSRLILARRDQSPRCHDLAIFKAIFGIHQTYSERKIAQDLEADVLRHSATNKPCCCIFCQIPANTTGWDAFNLDGNARCRCGIRSVDADLADWPIDVGCDRLVRARYRAMTDRLHCLPYRDGWGVYDIHGELSVRKGRAMVLESTRYRRRAL